MHLLDTNIISYILENRLGIVERVFDIERKDEIRIPDIAYYEIYRGLCFRDLKKLLPIFERFAEYYGIVSLVPSTMRIAAKIYSALKHSGELIEDDDILIAALALEQDAVLVTNNVRHFGRIEGLKILSLLD